MVTYSLVIYLVILGQNHGYSQDMATVPIQTIPGYESLESCNRAAGKVKYNQLDGNINTACIAIELPESRRLI